MSEELKPCPFCGREAVIWSPDAYRYTQSIVGCEFCRIFCIDDFEENAITAWNRRAEAEANARLIAAAPEMYRLLQNFCYPEEPYDTRQAELSNKVWELLRRIDGEEEITAHEGTE